MITNLGDHNTQIDLIKQKVFHKEDSELFADIQQNVLVSIKKESDILFANLNKYHLFQEEEFHKYNSFYKNNIYNQLLNELDLKHHYKYLTEEVIQIKGTIPAQDQAAIYCSFHFGSYVHAASALRMLNKDFSIVSKSTQGENIVEWDVKLDEHGNKIEYFDAFKTIDPEAVDASFQIYNTLRNGKNVLIYLDRFNNTLEKTSKRSKIFELLNSKMFITSGIPEISKKLNVPMIPLICERHQDTKIHATFYEAVFKADFSDKEYVKNAVQKCVDAFAIHLATHPEQWDHWPSIHNHLIKTSKAITQNKPIWKWFLSPFLKLKKKKQKISDTDIITFNKTNYEMFEREGDSFIININNYHCFKVSSHLMKILTRISESGYKVGEVKSVLNASLYADLFQKKVLQIENSAS
ncbi:hypothetical protein IMCC3317_22620 [Kordia antarctica]|uniref:Lipid A biosynthesis lauroyltransferase n=2 Tax=Kordia antarctica TaxID=1218801 RepID=A0A7L4ZJT2_9FLAO|nr:hypothetical protein IMCC3317_22620 [Kordia antarctica]